MNTVETGHQLEKKVAIVLVRSGCPYILRGSTVFPQLVDSQPLTGKTLAFTFAIIIVLQVFGHC